MKLLLTILLIAILMAGATVSLLTMNHNGDCMMSYAAGMACPQFDVLAYIGLHVNFLKHFSEAFLVLILAILFVSALFISFVFSFDNNFYLNKSLFERRFVKIDNTGKLKQIHWLSLFENSPTIS